MDYTFKDFIRCLSTRAGTLDRRYLTYLAFLTQYDIYNLGIVNIAIEYTHDNKPITRSKFFIGYHNIIELDDLLYTEDIDLSGRYVMPQTVEKRIKDVIHKHAKKKTWQLAATIKKKLRLMPNEKRGDYLGKYLDHYFYTEKFKVIKKEI
jgi:Fe-S cluster biosynthesis and repair protein YggX